MVRQQSLLHVFFSASKRLVCMHQSCKQKKARFWGDFNSVTDGAEPVHFTMSKFMEKSVNFPLYTSSTAAVAYAYASVQGAARGRRDRATKLQLVSRSSRCHGTGCCIPRNAHSRCSSG